MDARRARPATVFILLTALATSLGCNPVGWGISQAKSLIHHHAHKPIVRDIDDPQWMTPPGGAQAIAEQGAA